MSESTHRDLVKTKTFRSASELISFCSSISSGWYRCQAIALGAERLSDNDCRVACDAARKAASSETDQYRKIAPLGWPTQALASRGLMSEAHKLATFALEESKKITPPNSRAEALATLCRFSWELDEKYRRGILVDLFLMAESEVGRRIGRSCASISAEFDIAGESSFVDELLSSCKNEKLIARVERDRAKRGQA